MSFHTFEILTTVAEAGSISKAADKLYMAQPSLSQSLHKIETQFGYELFERGRSGLKLTFAGEKYVELSRKILSMKAEVENEIQHTYKASSKKLILGISALWSSILLPGLLPELYKQAPGTEVFVKLATSCDLEVMLENGELDMGILTLPLEREIDDRIEYKVLFIEQILVAVSKSNPLTSNAIEIPGCEYLYLDPALLHDQPFILALPRYRLRDSADIFFKINNVTPKIILVENTVHTNVCLAASGVGVTFVNKSFAKNFPVPHDLTYFVTDHTLPAWTVVAATRKKTSSYCPLADLLANFAVEKFSTPA